MAEVREGLLYTRDHEWLTSAGAERQIGITAYAVEQLGDITMVDLKVKVGDRLTAGKAFGSVESVKSTSDLYAPVSGKVTRVNGALEGQPELMNNDPYAAWIVAVEVEGGSGGGELMDAASYGEFLKTA